MLSGFSTLTQYVDHWAEQCPDKVFLRDCVGEELQTFTWQQTREQSYAVAAWLEQELGDGSCIALLSKNRAHWVMADIAIVASGNISVPQFTTQNQDTAKYIFDFTGVRAIIVGEADNWALLKDVLPADVRVIALPGFDPNCDHTRWEDIVSQCADQSPSYSASASDLISLVFTSGTTGLPKGVMQTHDSMILPVLRGAQFMVLPEEPRFFSYLPLAHIGERQLIWFQGLVQGAEITFNETQLTLLRDLAATRPHFFFGAPRVWEQLQQVVLSIIGGKEQLEAQLAENAEAVGAKVRTALGLDQADYLLSAAAPIPPSLIHWYGRLGMTIMEGYGQTEAMFITANSHEANKVGSIGRALDGVEVKLSEDGELLVRGDGLSTGYYKNQEKTAETFVDGWVHTGDKARIDEDGFVFSNR